MLPLSDWMLDAVCKDMLTFHNEDCELIRMAINVSPQSLDKGNFSNKIQQTLSLHGISPKLIEVEMTENIAIRNTQHAIDQLNELTQIGICVAIDDFGTGYSSLAYLHRFPINTIKVDQVFVREIQAEDGHYPVVLAIISIARGLGLNLIAEGVETEIQARYLQHSGCDTMQGYFFHRPMPLGSLIKLLKEQAARAP
jgi:EAL domain-containing protein (putative c-di-GMP-specific phosphodiesterase class I)